MIFVGPLSLGCQSQPSAKTRTIEHKFSANTTLIEAGDTLTLIHRRHDKTSQRLIEDTSVFLMGPDSSMIQLGPHGPKKTDARYAMVLYRLLRLAKMQETAEKKMGIILH